MTSPPVGPLIQAFILDGLQALKGLRPSSVRSYRDTLRLWLQFVAADTGRRLTRLTCADFTADRVRRFLRHLEEGRHNRVRTRNQRLACLHTFFADLASRVPECLAEAERVAAIPTKRVAPPATRFLEREEVQALFAGLPQTGRHADRDRALLLFLYNTGARVQEVAELRFRDLDLTAPPRVRLHGKGDKWRTCPLWPETAQQLAALVAAHPGGPDAPVFAAAAGRALTRFGIYKLVRRHAGHLDGTERTAQRRISPHVLRHTTAVHLLEAGVEINVIRGWLGHVSLDTTNRYAELSLRAKEAALRLCEPPVATSAAFPQRPVWRTDESLLAWLKAL
jgi:site-specific recombinase XerD